MENLTIKEAAWELQVTTQAVNDLIKRGILTVEAGRPKRITADSLAAWRAHREEKRQRIVARIMAQATRLGLVTE